MDQGNKMWLQQRADPQPADETDCRKKLAHKANLESAKERGDDKNNDENIQKIHVGLVLILHQAGRLCLCYDRYMQENHHHEHAAHHTSLNKTSLSATLHCLTGCAIGEVLGMIISSALGWATLASIVISVVLAFFFGYGLSMRPILKHGLSFRRAAKVAFASDTASIATMEITDNLFIMVVPGAISAGLSTFLFWWSLAISLFVAFWVAFPVNRYLIARGKGHAVAHQYHH